MKQIIIILLGVYILGYFAHALYLGKTVYGDGIYYYAWLRSAVIDHDIDFQNEYKTLGGTQPLTDIGFTGNKYSIGPAILWSPAYMFVHSVFKGNGYTLPYQLAVGGVSVILTLIGLLLLFRLLQTIFEPKIAALTSVVIAGTTNLLFYGSIDPVNSHALSFFIATVFLSLLMAKQQNWLVLGAVLGLLTDIRMQDIVYAILLIPFIKNIQIFKILLGFVVAIIPQLIAWKLLYGSFWISPYLRGGEGFIWSYPKIIEVLFNVQNGLFLWTPMVLFGLVGLLINIHKKIPFVKWMIVVFALELLIVATWSSWNQGASYSGRMFVSSLPIIAFGIASLFAWLQRHGWTQIYYLLIFIIPLTAINASSIIRFLLAMH